MSSRGNSLINDEIVIRKSHHHTRVAYLKMKVEIPQLCKIAKERLSIFQGIADEVKKNYRMSLIHSKAKVLFENKVKGEGKFFGRDEYFNSVIVNSDENLIGKIKDVKINQCNQNTLFGEVIFNKNYKENAA